MLIERGTPDLSKLVYPVYTFPKLDGIRCLVIDGVPKTRTLKDVPNKYIREALSRPEYNGFDGELIVGDACSKSVYRDTNSVVMSHDKTDYFYYFVFDNWSDPKQFSERYHSLNTLKDNLPENIIILSGILCLSAQQVLDYEQLCLSNGYEGLILRNPMAHYKFGRTTMKEANTYKLKRFVDSEAEVLAINEEMENTNDATIDETGHTKRSTRQSGLIGKGRMGSITVRDLESRITFEIGSGFTQEEREWFWSIKGNVDPVVIKYKSFMIGVKDKPRHPIYLGLRSNIDM